MFVHRYMQEVSSKKSFPKAPRLMVVREKTPFPHTPDIFLSPERLLMQYNKPPKKEIRPLMPDSGKPGQEPLPFVRDTLARSDFRSSS